MNAGIILDEMARTNAPIIISAPITARPRFRGYDRGRGSWSGMPITLDQLADNYCCTLNGRAVPAKIVLQLFRCRSIRAGRRGWKVRVRAWLVAEPIP